MLSRLKTGHGRRWYIWERVHEVIQGGTMPPEFYPLPDDQRKQFEHWYEQSFLQVTEIVPGHPLYAI